MLGAGLFAGFAPASAIAGRWLLAGAAIAALIALCSAFSTADQSRMFPGSGGGYRFTHEHLGRVPGRLAGGVYLLGRMAAAAALAGCFGDYVAPGAPLPAALAMLTLAVGADALGVRLPRAVIRALLVLVLAVLIVVVTVGFLATPAPGAAAVGTDNPGELLPVGGVMFFGFLGIERITAPGAGQPVVSRRLLPLVIPVLVVLALVSYLAVGGAVLRQLGSARLATSATPLSDALVAAGAAGLTPLVTAAVVAAICGGLLSVVGGARRTVEVMAAEGDLPATTHTPGHGRLVLPAAALVGVGGAAGVLLLGTANAINLAATCALTCYAFINAAARMLHKEDRIWPSRSACFGLGLCVLVGLTMPPADLAGVLLAMLAGVAISPLGTVVRRLRRYLRPCD